MSDSNQTNKNSQMTQQKELEPIDLEEMFNEKPKVYDGLKRILDLLISILVLPFVLLIMLITAIAIKIEDGGPIFYSQKRVGYRMKEFDIYKMRSMVVNAENISGAKWAEKDDPRITKVGRFIRKTRIDELPQFLNIIKGDMALIGPRPERKDFTLKFNMETPGFIKRLNIRPGITGWAQINGGYELNHEEKLKYDLEYIQKRGPLMDLKIVFRTIKVILTGNGAR